MIRFQQLKQTYGRSRPTRFSRKSAQHLSGNKLCSQEQKVPLKLLPNAAVIGDVGIVVENATLAAEADRSSCDDAEGLRFSI